MAPRPTCTPHPGHDDHSFLELPLLSQTFFEADIRTIPESIRRQCCRCGNPTNIETRFLTTADSTSQHINPDPSGRNSQIGTAAMTSFLGRVKSAESHTAEVMG